ncbi:MULTISPECIES: TIGR03086 family metal-binding protein [Micromonospora]|uniref:TIGR03086 family protein n=1 Tax=Micromonospora sicca TaxID=2202420 RepID=A0A317DH17_9ACTN|nr:MULTISPECIES: TIGR03086 family metal-binding protein [unclassified Micromonospora]MBM0226763.1 TIGR03086 family protein [Micromonospora sp. ATA51]PWR14049.1 TIGR03086 family protein [Micromonospora sp. 4G51]
MTTKTSELLATAAPRTVAVVRGISDDQLSRPTPCPDYLVRDLLNHLYDVVVNFQALARRREVDWSAKTDHLTEGWRDRFAAETARLVEAWADPASLEGVSPGMGLPQETVGAMALTDLTVHAWDLARATGQRLDVEPEVLAELHGFMDRMGDTGQQMGAFAAPHPTTPDATDLDRLLSRTGRNPIWHP